MNLSADCFIIRQLHLPIPAPLRVRHRHRINELLNVGVFRLLDDLDRTSAFGDAPLVQDNHVITDLIRG